MTRKLHLVPDAFQGNVKEQSNTPACSRPASDDDHAVNADHESMQTMVETVREDLRDLSQFYNCSISAKRLTRMRNYFKEKSRDLDMVPFAQLDQDGRADYILLRRFLLRQMRLLDVNAANNDEMQPLLQGFAPDLVDLLERRQTVVQTDGQFAGSTLSKACESMKTMQHSIDRDNVRPVGRYAAYRAVNVLNELWSLLEEWFGFYKGYDPVLTWWIAKPCDDTLHGLKALADVVRRNLVGLETDDRDAIVGQPIGRPGLITDLEAEMIPYSPEELIRIGENEYRWCEDEMRKASRDLDYGDDWRAALEHVKNMHVQPGEQPRLVHELAIEAIDYVKSRDMVTIPRIAEENWRTYMMSPDRQKVNPFFLGGPYITVSYPTDTMSHDDKMMSMRGNNRPFSRSTVFHELIPGHHLQFHMFARYRQYRSLFATPFWMEGWAFYWEFVLWDRGFPGTPENKIGMLFWRMHRCARIVFSLKFHLGLMTPQECIEYLVEKVGHERATAEGEVRRSFNGDWTPLYQAGYMLGALQLYKLRQELVDSDLMAEKEFHDRILRSGQMPIEMLRALLEGKPLTHDYKENWRFYDI